MINIQSLLKSFNLKQLIHALSNTYSHHPLPFYLIKLPSQTQNTAPSASLFLNRTTSNSTIQSHLFGFSVWSPHHLHRLAQCQIENIKERTLLKNPFKSQELIKSALQMQVKDYVIDSYEEYQKIQKIKDQHCSFSQLQLRYFWAYSQEQQNLQALKRLRRKIRGITFEWQDQSSISRVDSQVREVIKAGNRIQKVICSGPHSQISQMKKWATQSTLQFGKVEKSIEIEDYSDVDKYILAARSNGKGPLGIERSAVELVEGCDYASNCVMINTGKQEWLLSRISRFPLNQSKHLFEVQSKSSPKGFAEAFPA